MKKSLKILTILACLALTAGFAACGGDGNKGGATEAVLSYTLNEDGNGYTVSGCEVIATHITIPAEYNGKPVTAIGDRAFFNRSELEYVSIPDTVTSIGDFAFSGCWNLGGQMNFGDLEKTDDDFYENVAIPDSVVSIGEGAFMGCGRLTEIVISDSVASVGENAFSYCSRLQDVTIENVWSVGASAFANCDRLTRLTLAYDGQGAEENTFFLGYLFGASNYTQNGQYVPASLTNLKIEECEEIPANAFYGCKSLLAVEINGEAKNIGDSAFANCNAMTKLVLSDAVVNMGDNVFENCARLSIYSKATAQPSGWAAEWNGPARAYWYSGQEPVANPELYWQYDDDGEIVEWAK